jgi:hypothetical protein
MSQRQQLPFRPFHPTNTHMHVHTHAQSECDSHVSCQFKMTRTSYEYKGAQTHFHACNGVPSNSRISLQDFNFQLILYV